MRTNDAEPALPGAGVDPTGTETVVAGQGVGMDRDMTRDEECA